MADELNVREFRVIPFGNIGKFVTPSVQDEIRKVAKICSRIAIYTSIHLHVQAMLYAREGMDGHLDAMFGGDGGFKSQAYFREMHTCPDAPFSELARDVNLNEPDTKACRQPLLYLAQEYDTNLKNNVVFRRRRWLRVLFICFCRSNALDEPN